MEGKGFQQSGTHGTAGLRLWKRDKLLQGFQAGRSSAAQPNHEPLSRVFSAAKRVVQSAGKLSQQVQSCLLIPLC